MRLEATTSAEDGRNKSSRSLGAIHTDRGPDRKFALNVDGLGFDASLCSRKILHDLEGLEDF